MFGDCGRKPEELEHTGRTHKPGLQHFCCFGYIHFFSSQISLYSKLPFFFNWSPLLLSQAFRAEEKQALCGTSGSLRLPLAFTFHTAAASHLCLHSSLKSFTIFISKAPHESPIKAFLSAVEEGNEAGGKWGTCVLNRDRISGSTCFFFCFFGGLKEEK